jgi:hypothetical protein
MKLDTADLRYLALPFAIAFTLILAGAAALILGESYRDQLGAELAGASAMRRGIQTRLLRATDEEREIRRGLQDYERLRGRGVIADEHRLDWVEALKAIKSRRGLADLRYSIEPRQPLDYPGIRQTPGVEFLHSALHVDADLLHEADLLALLGDLERELAPIVLPRSCTLTRSPRARPDGYGPHLRADCLIDLITIRDQAEGSR